MDELRNEVRQLLENGIELLDSHGLTRIALKRWAVEVNLTLRELTGAMAEAESTGPLPCSGGEEMDLGI